ncbi:MAG: 1-deoxy-D-xylulose-5-phosphate reductoisomerase [Lachnospiraceae bacterium]|nr:1-deoxy-D-xylulose-5-phosphate reductoisomerase [Lachnospiraceae bacterium]
MKTISLLGSTGSIGTQTLEVVRENPDLKVAALAANANIALLEKQAREFNPSLVCVFREDKAEELKKKLADTPVKVVSGMDGLIEAACVKEADITVGAVVGMIGIRPTMEAIKAGKDIAIANKETLVCAGHLIMPLVKEHKVRLLPVDSEHSAIFQCLHGEEENRISRILLTASGGPFRGYTKEQLRDIRPEDALKHPNWSMGAKITIDSSTLVNKGLEVMEAHWLFDVPYEKIEVVVQPQSLIHSMVEFEDGGIKAQLGVPDMKLPIAYALFYPERRRLPGDRVDFSKIRSIAVDQPDRSVFEGLDLAVEAGKKGGSAPTIFNAANEYAVSEFLHGRLSYPGITEMIRTALKEVPFLEKPSLKGILDTEQKTYEVLRSCQM